MARDKADKKKENEAAARLAVPQYIEEHKNHLTVAPPGHRFLLYFKGWGLGDKKRDALKEVCNNIGDGTRKLLDSLRRRQDALAVGDWVMSIETVTTSPITTGLGNPHPVENGFAFLSPYGVPYLAGSGVKGVVRRAAEELALFDDKSPWTIPLVWALFGFEAGSAYLAEAPKDAPDVVKEAGKWREAFEAWLDEKAEADPVLGRWLDTVSRGSNSGETQRQPSDVLRSWLGKPGEGTRKEVHWQGLLRFWDAFPDEDSELDVDILNPHHKNYYEGEGPPHDSESPVPVFFLVIKPGARFRFIVEMKDRAGLAERVPDWRGLVGAAFGHVFQWLGFGAKTAVGYGAMDIDREEETRQKEKEKAREREAEEKRKLEEERKREEELAALQEAERLARIAETAPASEEGENLVNSQCYPKLDSLEGEEKKRLAQALMEFYKRISKWEGKISKKQSVKVQKIKEILGI